MEPSNSVQGDHSDDLEDGDASVDGSKGGADEPDNDELADNEHTGSLENGATGQAEGDADEMSVDEWLAEAEVPTSPSAASSVDSGPSDTTEAEAGGVAGADGDGVDDGPTAETDADPDSEADGDAGTGPGADGSNMSDIMAELLAAAEENASADSAESSATVQPDVDPGTDGATTVAAVTAVGAAGGAAAAVIGGGEATDDTDADKTASAGEAPGSTESSATERAADKTDGDAKTEADADSSAAITGTEDEADSGGTPKGDTTSKAEADGESGSDGRTKAGATAKADGKTKTDDKTKADAGTKADGKSNADGKTTKSETDSTSKADSKSKADGKTTTSDTDDKKTDDKPKTDGKAAKAKADDKKTDDKTAKPGVPAVPAVKKSSRSLLGVKVLVGTVIGLYALLVAAWGIDMAGHNGRAMRGVQLAGLDVGGQDREALDGSIDQLRDELSDQPLTISVGDVEVVSDPVTVGARFDRDRMIDEALDARRDGVFFMRPITWALGLFGSESIEARYLVDTDAALKAAEGIIADELDEPVEPTLELVGGAMTATPGSTGVTVEPREIVGRLPTAIEDGTPYRLALLPQESEPELDTAVITELADEINTQTEQAIAVQVLDDIAEVSPRTQLSWIDMEIEDGEPGWVVNEGRALEDLKPLFPTLGSEDQQATFKVVDEEPIIVPASETVICCEAGAGELLQNTIQRRISAPIDEDEGGEDEDDEEAEEPSLRTVTLNPEITGFDEGVAELESLGIIEQVSTFTTEHACCENRVKNIQRFADLMQGVIIRPGEELSLNGHVGQRTIEKGFFSDGAIALGNFEKQVGGGISQYATTFFNASFFAGVEFLEYQSHSIYLSRYPRGREATISWRKPDLKIRNNTEYGILVWNEYTDTSITVSFYSTKHLEVEALPLKRSSDRQCRIDITPRVITYPDGTQAEDRVFASYRPGQGLDCNGNSTTPDEDPKPAASQTPAPAPAPTPEPEPTPTPEPDPVPDPDPGGGEDEVLPPGG